MKNSRMKAFPRIIPAYKNLVREGHIGIHHSEETNIILTYTEFI
ncbi:hypothetical protein ACFPU1_07595 [Thalassorhabdus alkalitolerans]|uniref:Uncharacterized protein n=1 Tax=Thalassorhabdus alkalitolerans TaxID=2282697 RepID=A0ABW0YLL3_9BACI|nr:hypothetical protein [Thalassobacillus sp. C254]